MMEDADKIILLPRRQHAKPKNRLITRKTTVRPFQFTTATERQQLAKRRKQGDCKKTPAPLRAANESLHSVEDGIGERMGHQNKVLSSKRTLEQDSSFKHGSSLNVTRTQHIPVKEVDEPRFNQQEQHSSTVVLLKQSELYSRKVTSHNDVFNSNAEWLPSPKDRLLPQTLSFSNLCETDSYVSLQSSGQGIKTVNSQPVIEHVPSKRTKEKVLKHNPVTETTVSHNSKSSRVHSGSIHVTDGSQFLENNLNLLNSSQRRTISPSIQIMPNADKSGQHSPPVCQANVSLTKQHETSTFENSNHNETALVSGSKSRRRTLSTRDENNVPVGQDMLPNFSHILMTPPTVQISSRATHGELSRCAKNFPNFENSVCTPNNADALAAGVLQVVRENGTSKTIYSPALINTSVQKQNSDKTSVPKRRVGVNLKPSCTDRRSVGENSKRVRYEAARSTNSSDKNYSTLDAQEKPPAFQNSALLSANTCKTSSAQLCLNSASGRPFTPSKDFSQSSSIDSRSSGVYPTRDDNIEIEPVSLHNSTARRGKKVKERSVPLSRPVNGQDSSSDELKVRIWCGSKKRLNKDVIDLDFAVITVNKVMDEFSKGLQDAERKMIADFHQILIQEIIRLIQSVKKYRTDYKKFSKVGKKFRQLREQFYEENMKCSVLMYKHQQLVKRKKSKT